ncbi:MAG: hypothetical protein HFG82_10900 [Dorea sp.]|jgi:hypothetical protein|nr:hypothetical protein [Dorea sp.]
MKRRRDRNLHVVREQEDPTDRIVREILDELNSEDDFQRELEEPSRRHRRPVKRRWLIGIFLLLTAAVGVYLLVNLQTYGRVRVIDAYKSGGASNNSYKEFAGGVFKYSRDGIAYLDQKGEEQWNHSYQIKNPQIETGNESAVVADKGGNDILVIQKDGVKGEIHTAMPIEKVTVSEQGIVGAILKNDTSAEIICYDIAGNILVEHKTSSVGTGYPLDIALSENGEVMQVLYFYTQDGAITSKVMYYNFGEVGKAKTDNQVSSHEYKDTIMASGFFLGQDTSVAVGDNCLAIYQGKEVPEEVVQIAVDKEIKSVVHNKNYIGLILKNEGKEGYELRLYNGDGKLVISKDFIGDYSNIKLCGRQVIMYEGKKCSIFMRNGIQKFDGEMENNIMEIFPVSGVNKYIVMSADGMEKVRLVK